jgi:hypothetical protein
MITSLNTLHQSLKPHYDVFIASASYEKRCFSIINAINNSVTFKYRFVSLSVPHRDLIAENLRVFETYKFDVVEVNNSNQIKMVRDLVNSINLVLSTNAKASFLIDISTFTKQTLLILLRLLRNILNRENEIEFLYTPAKEYSVGLPYKDKWLTQGTLSVNSIFGYSGVIRPSRPYHLIILMGYEVERASSLINAYEPSKISIGYARKIDSIADDHYELNKQKFDELLVEFPYAESFEFSCIKVEECKFDILNEVNKYIGYNVIVSPMNNKISTISCALAAFSHDEIQLAIAIPATYNYENYSVPGESCYILKIPEFIKQ